MHEKNSHDGSHESPQYDDSTILPRSDASLSQQTKPLRRSSKSIKPLQKAQRNGLDKTSPGTYHDPEDLLSLANAALHMHQTPISPSSTNPTSKVDGVVPLAATTRRMAEQSIPLSPPAKGGRDADGAAITKALHQ